MKTIFAVALFLSFGATTSASFANSIEDYVESQIGEQLEEQREQETRDFIESTMDEYRETADDRYLR